MSLLDNTESINKSPEARRARRVASKVERMLASPKRLTNTLIADWEQGFDAIWADENPAEILEAIGTEAAELFALSTSMIQFIHALLDGGSRQDDLNRLLAKVASKPETTTHEDGTVTINE